MKLSLFHTTKYHNIYRINLLVPNTTSTQCNLVPVFYFPFRLVVATNSRLDVCNTLTKYKVTTLSLSLVTAPYRALLQYIPVPFTDVASRRSNSEPQLRWSELVQPSWSMLETQLPRVNPWQPKKPLPLTHPHRCRPIALRCPKDGKGQEGTGWNHIQLFMSRIF
jgi:hypothetical protein